jgi:hypothetical protein
MANGFYEAMRAQGISYNTTASVRKFKCPTCGFEFSLVYARAIACQGCTEATKSCPKIRCSRCDSEFFIRDTPDVNNRIQERTLSDHICRIVNGRLDDLGIIEHNR